MKLPFTPPYDWAAMIQFLAPRAIPRVERVVEGRYERTFATGVLSVRAAEGENHLVATVRSTDPEVATRLRRLFDLDADSKAIDRHLAGDRALAARVRARPGIRVPGAWDPFELAVRAVLGQQVSVRAATTFAGRLVEAHGVPIESAAPGALDRRFPTSSALAAADLTGIGLTTARAATLRSLASAVAADESVLHARDTLEETVAKLCELPGIGPWTAQYIAMRALREPDAFPTADLGLLRALAVGDKRPTAKELAARAEAWRPFRAYAALRLWMQSAVS